MVNWKSPEAKDRLLAAVVAAKEEKKLLDYRKIATFYGQETTYDSIEGQFRKIRLEAKILQEDVESGRTAVAPPRGAKKEPKPIKLETKEATTPNIRKSRQSPPKKADNVRTGRICKRTFSTPIKQAAHSSPSKGNGDLFDPFEYAPGDHEEIINGHGDQPRNDFHPLNALNPQDDVVGIHGINDLEAFFA